MAAGTATIRVTRETRDLLATQARAQGTSISAMLEKLARDSAREALLRSEREAARADATDRKAIADGRAWAATPADGVD